MESDTSVTRPWGNKIQIHVTVSPAFL